MLLPRLFALLLLAPLAVGQTPFTLRVDKTPAGLAPDGSAASPTISADGSFVAFASQASDLSTPQINGPNPWNLFVRDMRTGVTEQVNLSSDGQLLSPETFSGSSWGARLALSADGRFLAFASPTNDVAAGDTNNLADVFLRDRLLGTTELISIGATGAPTLGSFASVPSISDDGRYVAFLGSGSEFTANPPPSFVPMKHAYIRDRQLGTTEAASLITQSAMTIDFVRDLQLSGDGTSLVYVATRGLLASTVDIKMWSRPANLRRTLFTLTPQSPFEPNPAVSINRTGTRIAFSTLNDGVVPGDHDGLSDVFSLAVGRGSVELASVTTTGDPKIGGAINPSLSPDGRYLAFQANIAGLAPGSGSEEHVYVRDLVTGLTTLGSINDLAQPGSAPAAGHALVRGPRVMSDLGRFLVFQSTFLNLASPAVSGQDAIIRHDRRTDGPDLRLAGLRAGATTTLQVRGATPQSLLLVGISVAGQGPFPSYWGIVDLSDPFRTVAVVADANGEVAADFPVSASLAGTHVFAKGLEMTSSLPTTSFHGLIL
jgi:Tol biopolymer transport system component